MPLLGVYVATEIFERQLIRSFGISFYKTHSRDTHILRMRYTVQDKNPNVDATMKKKLVLGLPYIVGLRQSGEHPWPDYAFVLSSVGGVTMLLLLLPPVEEIEKALIFVGWLLMVPNDTIHPIPNVLTCNRRCTLRSIITYVPYWNPRMSSRRRRRP
jgi:hypothetical protein